VEQARFVRIECHGPPMPFRVRPAATVKGTFLLGGDTRLVFLDKAAKKDKTTSSASFADGHI
jgi:hypothetical protein